jgi:hypothetical protein
MMIRLAVIVATSCLVLEPAVALAQSGRSSISGRVVAAENDRVLPRARITLHADTREVDSVFADDRGRFTLSLPEAGATSLTISKAGYAVERVAVDRRAPPKEMAVALLRGVAISGRVIDQFGEGALNVHVVARRQDAAADVRDSPAGRFEVASDDLGDYRLGGLPAGRYQVGIQDSSEQTTLELRPGDEVASINFATRSPATRSSVPNSGPSHGAGVIAGRVVTSSGRPIGQAQILALRVGQSVRIATTDAQGRFAVDGLSAGSYLLRVSAAGYVTIQYGQERATQAGRPLVVADGDTQRAGDIVLSRGTAVTGTIVDEHGEPMQGVNVRALQLRYMGGRTAALSAGPRDRRTDDRGRYRLYGLLPGTYIVVASVDASTGAANRGYAPVYYPGTVDAKQASPISADLGRDVSAIDLVLTQTRVARVTGMVFNADGTPFTSGGLLMMPSHRSGGLAIEPLRGEQTLDGRFAFRNVPPGDYVVQAMRPFTRGQTIEFAAQFVTVTDAGDPAPLRIVTSGGGTMSGRFVHEGATRTQSQGLMPFPADFDYGPAVGGGTFSGSYVADGTFAFAGLFGPTRFVLTTDTDRMYLKSVTIDGLDVTDTPFDFGTSQAVTGAEVVLSDAAAAISGHVTDSASAPMSNYSVIVFSTDRSKWFARSRFLRLARPLQDGAFEVAGLPPGEYWVAATDPVDGNEASGDWMKPETLERLSFRAQRVNLREKERFMTILRIIR